MVYYFKKTNKLSLTNTFRFSVSKEDEKTMRKEWVAKFWTLANFLITQQGDFISNFDYPLYYKKRNEAIKAYFHYNGKREARLLVLHTIDKYRFHWLDFYKVIHLSNEKIKLIKMNKKQVYLDEKNQLIDENGKIVLTNYEEFRLKEEAKYEQ